MSAATRNALYGKLSGDGTLTGMLAAAPSGYSKSVYYQQAPPGAQFPYVIFNMQTDVMTYTVKNSTDGQPAMEDELWLVKGVDHAESATTVDGILARLRVLLTDGALSISGKTQLWLRAADGSISYSETVDGERFIHSGA